MHSRDSRRHEVTSLSMSLLSSHALYARTFLSSNSYIGPYQRLDYFYPQHPVPTRQTRDTQELDRRWRPRLWSHISRMIAVGSRRGWLTECLRFLSLSLSLARSVIYRSSIWCSISSRLYAFPYARLLPSPSTPKPKLPIRRSVVISSPPIFSLPGLAAPYTGTHSDQ